MDVDTRDRQLQAFSNAVWQRHEAHHTNHASSSNQWPSNSTFHSNWPLIASDLIVSDWKVTATASNTAVSWGRTLGGDWVTDIPEEVLDPPPPPEVDWRDTYAAELASSPAIAEALARRRDDDQGDGIELVLERAELRVAERAVMRAWLYNPNLAQIAEDLRERPQTVVILHRNALHRLRTFGQNEGSGREPRLVSQQRTRAG